MPGAVTVTSMRSPSAGVPRFTTLISSGATTCPVPSMSKATGLSAPVLVSVASTAEPHSQLTEAAGFWQSTSSSENVTGSMPGAVTVTSMASPSAGVPRGTIFEPSGPTTCSVPFTRKVTEPSAPEFVSVASRAEPHSQLTEAAGFWQLPS